jgi:nicotinate-nucleotide pyrophosphorylase (carboxylating)
MKFPLTSQELAHFVHATLAEDVGLGGDVTARVTIPATAHFVGVMDTRDDIILCGIDIAAAFFRTLDPECDIVLHATDGAQCNAGTDVMTLRGLGRAMLTAERSALNTVQHLSGIATLTRQYVDEIKHTNCVLLDTRKTIPGLRVLEKYATRMGGAQNHRMRLDDGVLIKDNHIAVCGSVAQAVRAAKAANTGLMVQVEIDRLEQIEEALSAGADRLLLDNMSCETLIHAVALVAKRVPLEASGGVRLDTLKAIAETGVDYISVGRITQSAPAADLGLDFLV